MVIKDLNPYTDGTDKIIDKLQDDYTTTTNPDYVVSDGKIDIRKKGEIVGEEAGYEYSIYTPPGEIVGIPIFYPKDDPGRQSYCNDILTSDPVNHPAHYTDGSIEVIDFIEDKKLPYHLGNVVKYICRAGKKDPDKEIEDLRKAKWYLDRYLDKKTGKNE
jgi:hypothetical protein